jgi:hypothetical protein
MPYTLVLPFMLHVTSAQEYDLGILSSINYGALNAQCLRVAGVVQRTSPCIWIRISHTKESFSRCTTFSYSSRAALLLLAR